MKNKLYRSRKNRVVLGVCGGLGEYFEIDPVLVRVIFVFLVLLDGFGLLFYIALALVVPIEPKGRKISTKEEIQGAAESLKNKGKELRDEIGGSKSSWIEEHKNLVGALLILLGLLIMADHVTSLNLLRWGMIWPVILVALGFYVLFKSDEEERERENG